MKLTVRDVFTDRVVDARLNNDRVSLVTGASIPQAYCYLSPGWCDLQVNGFGGFDLNAADIRPDACAQIARLLLAEGITAWLPTVVTASPDQIEARLSAIARACDGDEVAQATVAGIHLEGPYLSPLEGARGAHAADCIHPPDWDEFSRWQAASGGRIRLLTLAPEQPGSVSFIQRLVKSGVVVAIGHSLAKTDQIAAAVDAGARLSTHLGNGIPAMLPRHPNPLWDQLADERLYASLIFDGHHLPPNVMRVMLRAKGPAKTILVSDAVSLARLPAGIYESSIGGPVELHADGRLSLAGTPYLAGSAISVKDAIQNAIELAGCTLEQAIHMATTSPTGLMGLDRSETNTIFKWDAGLRCLTVLASVVDGRALYLSSRLQQELSEEEE